VTAEVRSGEKIVKVKEERGLLQRFIVICRSRPELNLKQCIETYEFGLVPRSLFAADGTLLLAYDKAKIVQHLERLTEINQKENQTQNAAGESSMSDLRDTSDKVAKDRSSIPASNVKLLAESVENNNQTARTDNNETAGTYNNETTRTDAHIATKTSSRTTAEVRESSSSNQPEQTRLRVIITDGMALVNSMSKTDQIKTYADFAQAFIERVSTYYWFTRATHTESSLHRDDMEKSKREPPFPSVTCCIWLGTSCGRRGIYTYSMCSSPSS